MIHRYSSRRSPLKDFLAIQLQGVRRYERIAGFFSSSLLEVAGEALERMTPEGGESCGRVVCDSCLNPLDVQTARAAKWGMHREWCASLHLQCYGYESAAMNFPIGCERSSIKRRGPKFLKFRRGDALPRNKWRFQLAMFRKGWGTSMFGYGLKITAPAKPVIRE
jgi:hypothetical protein